nr:YcnI family protein [Actinocatenispora thailandica]
MMKRKKLLLSAFAGLIGAIAVAAPAAAHVTVNPSTAEPGSYARVTFRVPNETDTASTTKVVVYLPADRPIASVSVQPVPGWQAVPHKTKLAKPLTTDDGNVTEAVDRITWTARSGAGIAPGQFQEFPVSLGPLPKSGTLTFKALQTYSDGKVVRWIQTGSGDTEPENPAPVLTLAATGAPSAPAATSTKAAAAGASDGPGSGTALTVGVIGLVAGLAGLALGGVAFVRSRRADD